MPTLDNTPNNSFPYPTSANDGTDFATGVQDFADAVDGMWLSGTLAARPAATAVTHGTFYYSTDTGDLSYSNGTAWVSIQLFGLSPLAVTFASANITPTSGQLVIAQPGITVTLPSPVTANLVVGVRASATVTATAGVTVTTPAGNINRTGNYTASLTLGIDSAAVILQSDGSNWNIIAGQPDTGWQAITLATGISSAGRGATARLIGDRVHLRGVFSNGSGGTVNTLGTLPSDCWPTVQTYLGTVSGDLNATTYKLEITTAGVMSVPIPSGSVAASGTVALDGLGYSLS